MNFSLLNQECPTIQLGTPSYSITSSKIGKSDFAMLTTLWLLVLVCSIWSVGLVSPIAFLILSTILIIRNASNGMLLLLLIFYSPATTVGIPNIFTVIAGMTIFIGFLFAPVSAAQVLLRPSQVLLAAGAFVIYGAITTIFSHNIDLALPYYRKYLEGIALLVILAMTISDKSDLGRVLKWWAIAAALATIIKLVHLHIGEDTVLYRTMEAVFLNDEFGLEHRIHILHGGETGRRFLLPGEEPNYTSATLVFPLALALAFHTASKEMGKILWTILACMTAIACVGTYSRSGFIATLLVLGLYLLRGNIVNAIIPIGVLGSAFTTAVMFIPALNKRIFGINDAVNDGATGRFSLWKQALDMWWEAPIFGNGMSAFYDQYHGAVHNTYLQVLAETGIIGFTLYIFIIVLAVRIGRRITREDSPDVGSTDRELSQIALFGVLGFCIMIATVTFQDVKQFWLALSVYAAMHLLTKSENPVLSRSNVQSLSASAGTHG